MSRIANAWEQSHYNPQDGGDASMREALKDPREQIRYKQAELADNIKLAIHGNASAAHIEELISLHAKQTKGADLAQDEINEAHHHRMLLEISDAIKEQVKDRLPACDIDGMLGQYLSEARDFDKNKGGPITVAHMLDSFTTLRPPVIHQLARQGETLNIVAPSKRGKSWLVLLLALCVVTGKRWLDYFLCVPGRCLVLDNELHAETSTDRVRKVADALGLSRDQYAENLHIDNVRGRNLDIDGLGRYLLQFELGYYSVIILDALYRFLPVGTNENDNAHMTAIYNKLDRFAMAQQCVFVCIVHSSKGSQADKSIVDVGSGAGAMARAVDSHCILRQHEDPNAVVLDVAPRSYAPLDSPICLRWNWPLWTVDNTLDPDALHRPGRKVKPASEPEPQWTADRFAAEFGTNEPKLMAALVDAGVAAGIGERKAANLVRRAAAIGKLFKWPTDDKREVAYATVPAPESTETTTKAKPRKSRKKAQ